MFTHSNKITAKKNDVVSMEQKAIVVTWLFRTDLSNLNAGEGTSNLKEIKTYNNGLPYVSGQSVRHALRKAIQRENRNKFKCTPEMPCGDINNCWLCDMFGYLLPGEGEKRWSPIKASPAMGQIKKSLTTDMILRLVGDIECPKCQEKINPLWARGDTEQKEKNIKQGAKLKCPKCNKEFEAPYDIRQAIAYKQITDNTYRVSVALDINALGIHEVPIITGNGEDAKITGIKYDNKYGSDNTTRNARVKAFLDAISNISDFANQSREMTNTSPDIVLISVQGQYNHRLSSALKMNEDGEIEVNNLKTVLEDTLKIPNTKIYAGIIKGVLKPDNETKMLSILKEIEGLEIKETPRDAINAAKNLVI